MHTSAVSPWFCLQCSCKKCLQSCDSAGFNALYYVLFRLFLLTCVRQSVCVPVMYTIRILESNPAGYLDFFWIWIGLDIVFLSTGFGSGLSK